LFFCHPLKLPIQNPLKVQNQSSTTLEARSCRNWEMIITIILILIIIWIHFWLNNLLTLSAGPTASTYWSPPRTWYRPWPSCSCTGSGHTSLWKTCTRPPVAVEVHPRAVVSPVAAEEATRGLRHQLGRPRNRVSTGWCSGTVGSARTWLSATGPKRNGPLDKY